MVFSKGLIHLKNGKLFLFLIVFILISFSIYSVNAFTWNRPTIIAATLNVNHSETSNSSEFWDNLDDPTDIDHSNLNNLEWSVTGHTIDDDIDMNDHQLTDMSILIFADGGYLGAWDGVLDISSDLTPYTDLTHDLGSSTKRWNDLYVGDIYGDGTNSYFNQSLLITGDSPVTEYADANLWLRAEVNYDACINLTESTVAGISICYDGGGSGIFEIRNNRDGTLYMSIDSRDSGNITFYNDTSFYSVNIEDLNVTGGLNLSGDLNLNGNNITEINYICDSGDCFNLTLKNISWSSTYNETYDNYATNVSINWTLLTYNTYNPVWTSTFNQTYHDYATNVSINWTKLTYDTYNAVWSGGGSSELISGWENQTDSTQTQTSLDVNLSAGDLFMNQQSIYWGDAYIKGGDAGYLITDGTNDYMDTGYEPVYNGDFSIALWFKEDTIDVGGINDIVSSNAEEGSDDSTIILNFHDPSCVLGQLAIFVRDNDGGTNVFNCSTNTFNDNSWHFVVIGRNSSDIFMNIDNGYENLLTTATNGVTGQLDFTSYPFYVGARNNRGSDDKHFDGNIDEVMFFDDDLTPTEITTLYNKGRDAGSNSHSDLQVHYRFDDGTADDDKETSDGSLENGADTEDYKEISVGTDDGFMSINGYLDILGYINAEQYKINNTAGWTGQIVFDDFDEAEHNISVRSGLIIDWDKEGIPPP